MTKTTNATKSVKRPKMTRIKIDLMSEVRDVAKMTSENDVMNTENDETAIMTETETDTMLTETETDVKVIETEIIDAIMTVNGIIKVIGGTASEVTEISHADHDHDHVIDASLNVIAM